MFLNTKVGIWGVEIKNKRAKSKTKKNRLREKGVVNYVLSFLPLFFFERENFLGTGYFQEFE